MKISVRLDTKIPSINNYWINYIRTSSRDVTCTRKVVSRTGKDFKNQLSLVFKDHMIKLTNEKISLEIAVAFRDSKRDLDSILKPICSALEGIVYYDSKQIKRIWMEKDEKLVVRNTDVLYISIEEIS